MADTDLNVDATQPRTGAWFTTTQWNIILAARDADSEAARAAREQLCRTYWAPLYAYVRRHGHKPHDAQDHLSLHAARLRCECTGMGIHKPAPWAWTAFFEQSRTDSPIIAIVFIRNDSQEILPPRVYPPELFFRGYRH